MELTDDERRVVIEALRDYRDHRDTLAREAYSFEEDDAGDGLAHDRDVAARLLDELEGR